MSKPPILPLIDWKAVYALGRKYYAWLTMCPSVENRDRMERRRQGLTPISVNLI